MPLWLSLLPFLVILATSIYVLVITEVGPPENDALTSRGQRPVLTRAISALREACRKYAGTQGYFALDSCCNVKDFVFLGMCLLLSVYPKSIWVYPPLAVCVLQQVGQLEQSGAVASLYQYGAGRYWG